MEKIFTKKLTKKGFTLAELLIVVAIIAVLTAIAAPLFFGALKNAEKSVENANIRAVRAAAVTELLMNSQRTKPASDNAGDGKEKVEYGNGPWKVTATVSSNGEISKMTIVTESGTVTDGYDRASGVVTVGVKQITASLT